MTVFDDRYLLLLVAQFRASSNKRFALFSACSEALSAWVEAHAGGPAASLESCLVKLVVLFDSSSEVLHAFVVDLSGEAFALAD